MLNVIDWLVVFATAIGCADWRIQNFNLGGHMASAERDRAYNEGLGAEPPAGSRGRAPGQGVRGRSAPEAESILTLGRPTNTTNLHPWPVAVSSV